MALEKGYNGDSASGFEIAPDGVYVCELKRIEERMMPKYGETDVEEKRWMWAFESVSDTGSDGQPYEFTHWTGYKYGHDKAKLTLTLDSMLGVRLTEEEWTDMDPEAEFVGKKWRVMVSEVTTQSGKQVNRVMKISPMTPPRRTVAMNGAVAVESNGQTRVQQPRKPLMKAGGGGEKDARGRTPDDPNYDPYEGE